MGNKKFYCVFDCETATLPFANEIANGNPDLKKRIAIAKPIIYDAGWTICDRQGNIYDRKQFLIAETFSVPAVFNTAYYAEKRPRYLEMLRNGETTVKPWYEVMEIFLADLDQVDAVGAFNAMFDFKKAIPFTELYVNKLYSADYQEWEKGQRFFCQKIVSEKPCKDRNPDFEEDVFRFRGRAYNLFDLWGLATTHLLDNVTYKRECLQHNNISASGLYFKTSAETSYQYLCHKYDFIESHTALDDAEIETFILSKIAARHAVSLGIKFFPFRDLGTTVEFCRRKTVTVEEKTVVRVAISNYLENNAEKEGTAYYTQMLNHLAAIESLIENAR